MQTTMRGGRTMAAETAEIPAVIQRGLQVNALRLARLATLLADRDRASIITCARGSSDHAAAYFKYLVEIVLGVPVASVGPSVASVYRAPLAFKERIVVTVSQSGESPDLVAFQAAAREAGAFTIALVNREASPLALGAEAVLSIAAGDELSVPATKTAVGAMAVLAQLVAVWSGSRELKAGLERLAEACAGSLDGAWSEAACSLSEAQSLYVVGRGPALPVAQEAALKLKETAALHAEAFSAAELLHGPLQLIQPGFPVLLFAPNDRTRSSMDALTERLNAAGAEVHSTAAWAGTRRLPVVETGCSLLDPLPMLTAFYGLAREVACTRGHDPDSPSRLAKVTRTL